MKHFYSKKWILFGCLAFFMFYTGNLSGQSVKRESISSYGSAMLNGNLYVSQSAGQCYNTESESENNIAILQGFQQPNTFKLEKIEELSEGNLEITVYPNPASFILTIESKEEIEQTSIVVTDINGRKILSEKVNFMQRHSINCQSWPNGFYLIRVQDSNQNSKTLKLLISK